VKLFGANAEKNRCDDTGDWHFFIRGIAQDDQEYLQKNPKIHPRNV